MAEISPFCALRYNAAQVPIQAVIAPPYDVIAPQEQDALHARHPCNIVRVILGNESLQDVAAHNKYTRARQCLDAWMQQQILIVDTTPCLYLHEQEFVHPVTRARCTLDILFARLRLTDSATHVVLPHEQTHAGPKADRLKLLQAVNSNCSPVYMLYDGREGTVTQRYTPFKNTSPLYQFTDEQDCQHVVWAIHDLASIQAIQQALQLQSLIIADGHHRYATALAYRNLRRDAHSAPITHDDWNYVLVALVNLYDKHLVILPTHRIIAGLQQFDALHFQKQLTPFFSFTPLAPGELLSALEQQDQHKKVYGWIVGEQGWLLTAQDHAIARSPVGDLTRLPEVGVASQLLLRYGLGINEESDIPQVQYTRSREEVLRRLKRREAQCAILLRPPQRSEIQAVCARGELMPPKSTYFYPKMPSGLIMYKHGE